MRIYLEQDPEKKKENFAKYIADKIVPHIATTEKFLEENGTGFLVGSEVKFCLIISLNVNFILKCNYSWLGPTWLTLSTSRCLIRSPYLTTHQTSRDCWNASEAFRRFRSGCKSASNQKSQRTEIFPKNLNVSKWNFQGCGYRLFKHKFTEESHIFSTFTNNKSFQNVNN